MTLTMQMVRDAAELVHDIGVIQGERDEARRQAAELRSLLQDALRVQRTPCDHTGIGRPGCVTCDPRVFA